MHFFEMYGACDHGCGPQERDGAPVLVIVKACPVHGHLDLSQPVGAIQGPRALRLTDDELWMVYDLVTARTEAIDACEIEIRGPADGERWRLLRRKLRAALPAPPGVPA